MSIVREIVLDTETTGMDPRDGHRLVEIGCVELENHLPTGKTLQLYINPEREVPPEATAVHGLTTQFLSEQPVFSQVYSDFIAFIGNARLVIHNAEFDMKFINWELQQVGHPPIPWTRVTDTLSMARRKFPGSPANLDALCRRFSIDNTGRTFHGALLDSQLLADVYLELLGGRQHGLGLAASETKIAAETVQTARTERVRRAPRAHAPTLEEEAAHSALLEQMGKTLWGSAGG